jgi:putative membrane protein
MRNPKRPLLASPARRLLPLSSLPLWLLAVAAAGCSLATGDGANPAAAGRSLAADQDFLNAMARDGLQEVKIAQLAMKTADDPRVKDLGRHMIDEFEKTGQELHQIAAAKGLTLPADFDRDEKWDYKSLARLDGLFFDRYYVNMVVEYHTKDLRRFRREARRSPDPELRRFAAGTLPALEAGLNQAEALQPYYGFTRTYGGDTPN